MIAQHYKIIGNGSAITPDMKPGMFVYSSDGNEIIGFLYNVMEYTVDVILFEPTVTTESTKVVAISATVSLDDMLNMLRSALKANPRMMPMWTEHFNLPDITED